MLYCRYNISDFVEIICLGPVVYCFVVTVVSFPAVTVVQVTVIIVVAFPVADAIVAVSDSKAVVATAAGVVMVMVDTV